MGTITRGIANNVVTGGKLDGTDGLSGTVSASNIANASLTNITSVSPSLGFAVTSVASDPVSPTEGQIWYNTTSKTLKGYQNVVVAAAWASGGNLNTARRGMMASNGGTQTAALSTGGIDGPTSVPGFTELYNGTSWTVGSPLNTGRYAGAGFGTQTASIAAGGYSYPPNTFSDITESWNGTSWTNLPATSGNSGFYKTGTGTQTAGLVVGFGTTQNQYWNGSAWTTNPATMNTSLNGRGVSGTQISAIAAGGNGPAEAVSSSESYNGTSWTSTSNINTARYFLGAAGTSDSPSLIFQGNRSPGSPVSTATELWDGTSWTNTSSTSTPTNAVGSAGTATSALSFGGDGPPIKAATEEWTGAFTALQTRTLTVS